MQYMQTQTIPQAEWSEFLKAFSRRHEHWLVTIETHDLKTGETVVSRFMPLQSIQLDLEDQKNPRINVTVRSDLGLAYAALGDQLAAIRHLDKAIELDPDYEPAIVNRRVIFALQPAERLTCA